MSQEHRRRLGVGGVPDRNGTLHTQHRPVLPLQNRRRTGRLSAVVCPDRAAGQGGDFRGGDRKDTDRAVDLGGHLFRMDEQHPGLVHFATNLVGPQDSRLDLQGLWKGDRRGSGSRTLSRLRRKKTASGRGRSGYLVQLGAVALFDAGMAGKHGSAQDLLSDVAARDRF